jgi:DNA-binding transcriptional ArsR family regulator
VPDSPTVPADNTVPARSAPDYELADSLIMSDPAQYRALFEPTRSQLVSLLLDRAATTSELAEILAKPKGTIGFHLKTLEAAGLVRVVRTRRVRALEAKYYGRTARVFLFEQIGGAVGALSRQLRQAADEAGAVPEPTELAMTGGVRYARIPNDRAEEWAQRLHRLLDDFDREPRQGEQTFALVAGVYPSNRPRLSTEPARTTQNGAEP